MKKAFYLLSILGLFTLTFFSCNKEDETTPTSTRNRWEVFNENISSIENYMKSNYIDIDSNNEVSVHSTPTGIGTQTIWDTYAENNFNNTGKRTVPYRMVNNDNRTSIYTDGFTTDEVTYKLYYIILDEGQGENPTSVDSTYVAYKGWNLKNEVFDQNNTGKWFSYPETSLSSISGFRQIQKLIKTESHSTFDSSNGTVTHFNYGNIVVFIPAGLAYFNASIPPKIEAYSPIAFQIKLFNRKERDHDFDRVLSNYEDRNGDGNFFNDDTDGDFTPDFFDSDDDGDGYLTKTEVRYLDINGNHVNDPLTGKKKYYPFNGESIDDPSTTEIDETRGIPNCSNDYNTTPRVRKHVDPSCH